MPSFIGTALNEPFVAEFTALEMQAPPAGPFVAVQIFAPSEIVEIYGIEYGWDCAAADAFILHSYAVGVLGAQLKVSLSGLHHQLGFTSMSNPVRKSPNYRYWYFGEEAPEQVTTTGRGVCRVVRRYERPIILKPESTVVFAHSVIATPANPASAANAYLTVYGDVKPQGAAVQEVVL